MRFLLVLVGTIATGALTYWLTGIEGQTQEYQVSAGVFASLIAAAMLSIILLVKR